MSTYNDKTLKNVSETVMEILSEGSSTSRKPWRDINSPESKAARKDLLDRMDREKAAEPGKALLAKIKSKKQRNEEIEANEEILDEADETKTSKGRIVKTATGVRHYGSYGTSHYEAPQKKEKPKQSDDASLSDEEFRQKHGMSRKNYERMKTGVKIGESFTEMLEAYDQYGLAVFAKELTEEPDNETFTKEVERQKRKAAGTAPESELADVAAAAGKEHKIKEEVEQIDELSRETLTSYKSKVVSSYGDLARKAIKSKTPEEFEKNRKKAKNRASGALGAAERLGKMKNEEVEQIDEIHNIKHDWNSGTDEKKLRLKYGHDAVDALKSKYGDSTIPVSDLVGYKQKEPTDPLVRRHRGLDGMGDRLKKIINNQNNKIDERSLSDEENKKKEDYVKGMKKKMKAFKERYGKDAKSVMYATATKMAKGK